MRLYSNFCALLVLASAIFGQVGIASTVGQTGRVNQQVSQPVQTYNVSAKVLSITDDGALCRVSLLDNLHKDKGSSELDQPVLICGIVEDIVDGDNWKGDVYYAGIYKYTPPGGIQETVRAFATTEQLAVQRLALAEKQRENPSPTPMGKKIAQFDPPFGLFWGETDTKINLLITKALATIANTRTVGDVRIWEVRGLIQTGLQKTLFVFRNGALAAVDLYYGGTDWSPSTYNDFSRQLKTRIVGRFGSGQYIAPYTGDLLYNNAVLWGCRWKWGSTDMAELVVWSGPSPLYRESVSVRYEHQNEPKPVKDEETKDVR